MASESDPFTPQLFHATLTLAEVLNQHRVDYALIGGLAAGHRAHPRATRDIDLLLNVPQIVLPKVLDELAERGFAFDQLAVIREWIEHHMVVLSYDGIRVDWLKAVIPVYQQVLAHATEESWHGRMIRIASVEGLILMKLMAGRTQDWLDVENLVAVQREKLDLSWIRAQWQTLGDMDDPQMQRLLELVNRVLAKSPNSPPHDDHQTNKPADAP